MDVNSYKQGGPVHTGTHSCPPASSRATFVLKCSCDKRLHGCCPQASQTMLKDNKAISRARKRTSAILESATLCSEGLTAQEAWRSTPGLPGKAHCQPERQPTPSSSTGTSQVASPATSPRRAPASATFSKAQRPARANTLKILVPSAAPRNTPGRTELFYLTGEMSNAEHRTTHPPPSLTAQSHSYKKNPIELGGFNLWHWARTAAI